MAVDIRFWARKAMPAAIKAGISGNAFLGIIKKQYGKAYRHQEFQKDWREMAGIPEKTERLKYVRKEYRPTSSVITMTEGVQKRKYVYTFKMTGYDELQDKYVEEYMAVATDTLIPLDEAEKQAMENFQMYTPEVLVETFDAYSITQRKFK